MKVLFRRFTYHGFSRGRSIFVGSQRLSSCIKRCVRPKVASRQTGLEIGKFSSGNGWVLVVLNPQKNTTPWSFFFRRPELGGKNRFPKFSAPNPVAPNPTKPLGTKPCGDRWMSGGSDVAWRDDARRFLTWASSWVQVSEWISRWWQRKYLLGDFSPWNLGKWFPQFYFSNGLEKTTNQSCVFAMSDLFVSRC